MGVVSLAYINADSWCPVSALLRVTLRQRMVPRHSQALRHMNCLEHECTPECGPWALCKVCHQYSGVWSFQLWTEQLPGISATPHTYSQVCSSSRGFSVKGCRKSSLHLVSYSVLRVSHLACPKSGQGLTIAQPHLNLVVWLGKNKAAWPPFFKPLSALQDRLNQWEPWNSLRGSGNYLA